MLTNEELIQTPEYWMDNIQNELFRQLKKYMEANGINQTQFADKLKVSRGYISQVLNGNFNYTVKKLIELSLAMGVTPDLEFRSFADYLAKEQRKLLDWQLAITASGFAMKADKEKTVAGSQPAGIVIPFTPIVASPDPAYSKTA